VNLEHLEVLEQGADTWNKWRKDNPEISPDLQSAWLDKKDLRRFNFNNTDLRKAKLRQVNFYQATLFEADLSEADLQAADLRGSNLRRANLYRSRLNGAIFDRLVMEEADFRESFIRMTIFGDCDLSSVKGLESVIAEGPSTIGTNTVFRSQGKIPEVFLQACGVPETFITFAKSLVNSPIEFYSCFISYSSRNQDFAERLYADLQSKGVRCWYAPEDLKIGDRFRVRIDESIRAHEKLLLILSKESVESQWVEKEVETAMERERQQGRDSVVLFPIKLDDAILDEKSGWAADIRRTRHIGDFKGWKNHDEYRKAFDRLLRDLRAESARREGDAAGAETMTG
jgi:TIR domain-containing protein/pentapeptide repeat protein